MALSFSSLFKNNGNWLEQQQNSILSGLLRQRLLISKFFDTPASQQAYEAFLVAFQIPDMMFQLIIIGALSAAFIPIFTTYKKQDQALAFQISSIMMNVLLLVFLVVGVIVFIWAEPLTVWRTGHTFTPEQISIATRLTRIMLVAQFFFAVSNFLTGILQSFQRFIIPSIAPVLYNLGILMGVYLFAGSLGIYSAGLGVIIGAFMHMIVQLPLVMKLGFRYQFTFNVKLPGIREFFKLMPPRVLALSVNELRKLSLGFFATSLGNLSFVVMQLGLTLMAIPIRFFGVPISQASLPFLSDESDEKDRQRFTHLVLQSLNQIAFFTMPMSVLLLILRVPIVRLIFGTANFPWETTLATGRVVAIISISITVQGMVQLMMRAFYALKDTKTPFVIAMVDMIFYLLACAYFVFYTDLGVIGIALATSAAAFLEFILFIFFLNHKVKGLMSKAFWLPQFKMVMASFLMAVFLYLPFKILDELVFNTTRTIELLGLTVTTTTIGMVVYIYFAMLFNIYELQTLLKVINRFGPWKGILHKAEEVLLETAVEGDEV
jgi:putative peptidoglycan lipid II flippase